MRVLHSYCLNYNIGDYALGIGVKNLLRKYVEVDYIAETNIQGQYFDEYYINEVLNKKYDLLVIGGGGIIHGSHWPNGWFWLIEKDLIKEIKIPFIVYGIGNNYFSNEEMPERAVEHLKETFQKASYFSVRNDGSLERVKNQVGISPFEIPDPGFHVSVNTTYPHLLQRPYVIIQVANDKADQRFEGREGIDNFIYSMRNIVDALSSSYHVILAPHVFSDIELSEKIIEGKSGCSIWNFSAMAFDHCDLAISYYKYAEFVLAMRGHGQIIPLGFHVPVVALSNHPKHLGLMKKLNLDKYCVSVLEEHFEKKVLDIINVIEYNRDNIRKKLEGINLLLEDQSKQAFELIKERINLFNGR